MCVCVLVFWCVCVCVGCRRRGWRIGARDKQSGRRLLGAGRGCCLRRVRLPAGDAAGRQGAQQGEQGREGNVFPLFPKRVCLCSYSQYTNTHIHSHRNKNSMKLLLCSSKFPHAEHRRKRTLMPPPWASPTWAASIWSCSWAAALPACTAWLTACSASTGPRARTR